MRHLTHLSLACLTLVVAFSGMNPLQAQTDSMQARVSAEAAAHMALYYRYFSERNMDAMPDEVFTVPWMTYGANGINMSLNRAEALVGWQRSLIGLLQRGWDHSEFTVENVCVLNEGMAIVSGYNTRYAEDNTEMSVGSLVYFLGRTDAGWRITGYTSVEAGKLVSC
ncbi:MAG: hypothetical protein R3F50_10945 [Gammaproteobacteria bacterium]|jgi:hypothetical protein